jgi:osmotically-inducible protein OsmY
LLTFDGLRPCSGNITLTGTVRYGYQWTAAEAEAAALTGVRNVKDDVDKLVVTG